MILNEKTLLQRFDYPENTIDWRQWFNGWAIILKLLMAAVYSGAGLVNLLATLKAIHTALHAQLQNAIVIQIGATKPNLKTI